MNLIFLIYIPLVHSASHTFMTTYTRLNGQVAGTSEISTVTTLDGQQIDYYDGEMKLIPTQDWMKEFASGDKWEKYTKIREQVQQKNKISIAVLMQRFNHSHGVHMYKWKCGCVWDDETEVSDGFDQCDYDGERFISLDLKEGRYTAHVREAEPTVLKWNNDREQLNFLKQFYKQECIDWLKEFLNFSKATLSGQSVTEPIQKNPTVDDTNGSGSSLDASYFMYAAIIILVIIFILIMLYALWSNWNKLKHYYKKLIYYKDGDSSSPVEVI